VDLAAIFTGIAAIVTGAIGVALATKEVRRHERRSAQRVIEELEHDLNACHAENVDLHRFTFELRQFLADHGFVPPELDE